MEVFQSFPIFYLDFKFKMGKMWQENLDLEFEMMALRCRVFPWDFPSSLRNGGQDCIR